MINCENVFKRIDDMEQEYIKLLEEFCLIESPTDYKEGIDAAGNYIIKKAESFGWKVERQKQEVSGDCICITMNPDAAKPPVCLSGHMDTVHPVGLFGTPAVTYDGDKMFGPGIADCKGGIVAALMAMAALCKENFTDRPIKLILQSDEETSSAGSNKTTIQYMCQCARDAVAFLNCEPSVPGTAVVKRKGIAKYTFNITGLAAHAANCYNGISAISEAAHKIIELEKYKDENGITANCGIMMKKNNRLKQQSYGLKKLTVKYFLSLPPATTSVWLTDVITITPIPESSSVTTVILRNGSLMKTSK